MQSQFLTAPLKRCSRKNFSADYLSYCSYIARIYLSFRSSHRRCSVKKGVLGNFPKFIGKHLCQIFFLIKLQTFRLATLIKETPTLSQYWCFPVNIAKFLKTSILKNIYEQLLLYFLRLDSHELPAKWCMWWQLRVDYLFVILVRRHWISMNQLAP